MDNREIETFLGAVHVVWISVLGPFENLIVDGETSLSTKAAEERLKAFCVKLKL